MSQSALVRVDRKVTGQGELVQLVSFQLGNGDYGVEVRKVLEIIRMIAVTKVPNTPSWVEGVINLRGKVLPVISLRQRFDLPEQGIDSRTRIMVMEVAGELIGFVVDGVSEVIRVPGADIQPPPPMLAGGRDQDAITGVINHASRLLIAMDADLMLPPGDLASLKAA